MTLRPALIARFPEIVRNGLRPYGIHTRTLLLQDGNDILPAVEPPLVVDLCGQTPGEAARLLVALQTHQRRSGLVPHLLVSHDAALYQRLIIGLPALRAAVIAGNDFGTLATWLCAPLELISEQIWIDVFQPSPFTTQQHLTSLIAALSEVETITEAAQRCAIGRRTAYILLRHSLWEEKTRRSIPGWQETLIKSNTINSPKKGSKRLF